MCRLGGGIRGGQDDGYYAGLECCTRDRHKDSRIAVGLDAEAVRHEDNFLIFNQLSG